MKKFLSLVLALVMALSLTTVAWGATVVAKIGTDEYTSFAAALADVEDGETITIQNVAVDESGAAEVVYTNADDITFTITGDAPDYTFPRIEFGDDNDGGKITVNITSANLKIPVLGAYKNATVNVNNSTIIGKGYSQPTLKSYYNGAINISGGSVVYFHQITTMGYITVEGTGTKVTSTWQTQVLGNGLVTIKSGATYNTSALQLTGAPYKNRDNTDAARVGKPAEVIVDGGTLVVGEAYSASGADYSYESNAHGINIGTATDGDGVLTLKNNADVTLKQTGDTSTTHGGKISVGENGTVNVDNSTLSVEERGNNAGDVELQVAGNLNVSANSTVDSSTTSIAVQDGGTLKSAGDISGEISKETNGTIEVTGGSYTDDVTNYVANGSTVTIGSNTVVKNENGTVAVNPVAQVGNTKYTTVADAIAAAGANDVIILLDANATIPAGYEKALTTGGAYVVIPDTAGSATAALYDLKKANAAGTEVKGDIGYEVVAANKDETSGYTTGTLEYVKMDGKLFVKIAAADATTSDFYVTKANEKTAQFYLKQIDSVADITYDFVAVEFTNFGYKCDQLNASYVDYVTNEVGYYVWTHPVTGDKIYFADDVVTTGDAYYNKAVLSPFTVNVLVDDEVVEVYAFVDNAVSCNPVDPLNQHTWSPVAYDKTTPVKAQCGICGTQATVYKNNKAPAGSDVIDVTFNQVPYDLVIASVGGSYVPVVPSTGKVESAATFDAGIAMYVGMSVLAATGSAVVIGKKKD